MAVEQAEGRQPGAATGGGPLRGRVRLLVGAGLFLAGLSYFAFTAFQANMIYYFTVAELQARGESAIGQEVRVNGKLLQGSFQRPGQGTTATFTLMDLEGGQQLPVVYTGVVPDLFFNEEAQIMAEGAYGPDGVLRAENLVIKCPSKYASQAESG